MDDRPLRIKVSLAFPGKVEQRDYEAFLRRLEGFVLDDPTGVTLASVEPFAVTEANGPPT